MPAEIFPAMLLSTCNGISARKAWAIVGGVFRLFYAAQSQHKRSGNMNYKKGGQDFGRGISAMTQGKKERSCVGK